MELAPPGWRIVPANFVSTGSCCSVGCLNDSLVRESLFIKQTPRDCLRLDKMGISYYFQDAGLGSLISGSRLRGITSAARLNDVWTHGD